ncbi:MAG: hypothetical protein Q4C87_10450 [Actinomycetaceae bacterium]|nr:hypothetical protein [Actinomycetaceae bacterium]
MNISLTPRTFAAIATFSLASMSLSGCAVSGLSQGNACSGLKDANLSLADAFNDILSGNDASGSLESALEEMEAANEDLPEGEIKDVWEELIVTVEELIPLYEKHQELTSADPETIVENKEEHQQNADEMNQNTEALLKAEKDLVELCPELGTEGGGGSGSEEPGDSSDSEGRKE